MLTFKSAELESSLRKCLSYLDSIDTGLDGLGFEFYNIINSDFMPDEYDDVIIDEDSIVSLSPDRSDESYDMTVSDFIGLVQELINAKLIEKVIAISEKRGLVRVEYDYHLLENKHFLSSGFLINSKIDDIDFSCALKSGLTLFGLLVHNSGEYDKYLPSILGEDLFVEVIPQRPISLECYKKIWNSYIFELYATQGIKLSISPRPEFDFEYDNDEFTQDQSDIVFRPLLFGKGIDELLELYNNAENHYNSDFTILQYTRVLEYIAQTVARQDITLKVQTKLNSSRALRPDANYVKELETLFSDLKQKYETERGLIKLTVRTCCDIMDIIDCAPGYIDKIKKVKDNISKDKSDKDKVIEGAYEQLADSISDTRNEIAHSKASYVIKGKECPNDQKAQFVDMMRVLAAQAIRWFSNTNESIRIVSN